ncbi:MAG: NAD(P) transhydrogenase subunit alpha [Cellulomonas sp. 73-145]|uniref:Re/Si-specific NAD(P)(+) transhydrogenase subunit alpha n=1 Tax=Cellulomonas sp. 73-145 TaxID=1895739 RepID=UPI00092A587A|nr:Re/Si-specific NAD(P)(+) transhydrogenase subunit alpha [Cellulomonas sp. 73-145]OJV56922.1 MAG: NAD(P) transhydrogenase subunit alpha [Cellulomonas sp. 73-145]
MLIGIPTESRPGERLVAGTPRTVAGLVKLGYDVVVQAGAGAAASIPDEAYVAAGASVADAEAVWAADVVTAVNTPSDAELAGLRSGQVLVASLAPALHPELVQTLSERGVTALALDAVPRISRAQALDVLSTMSNVAGYRAVIEAAAEYGGMFTGQVTAAGKTAPATVFIIGGGVAGLAAIGAAASLGAQVRAFDVRPEAGEQIESLGATFVQASAAAQQERSATGYAAALTEDQEKATLALYAAETARADIVITTALVRGQAPRTITAEMVAAMRPGSVIVDLAASGGGNCELTVPGERVVTDNGVIILGYTDLTSRMPQHTSQLFGTNVVNLMALLTPAKDGQLVLDLEDPVQRGMTVTRDGEVLWPPPPVQVSAAPAAAPAAVDERTPEQRAAEAAAKKAAASRRSLTLMVTAGAVLAIALAFTDVAFLATFTVFVLAVFVGYYVISNVSHSLHTPLMSQTNAISGIILVGSLLQIGSADTLVTVLAVVSAAIASINVFGGFLVTYRMLGMFRKGA